MSNCRSFMFERNPVPIEICIEDESKVSFKHLIDLTEASFNLYSKRLKTTSNDLFESGNKEYDLNNTFIIQEILEIGDPENLSLSVTSNGTIHYTVRYLDGQSLFIETYLNTTDENQTFFELLDDQKVIFSGDCSMEEGLAEIKRLKNNSSQREFCFPYNIRQEVNIDC